MIHVLIVEDSRISREVFERELSSAPGYVVAAAIANAANAEIACMKNRIDLVLMDICTADGESGLEAAARIKRHDPQVKVIMMTSMPEHSFLQKAKAAQCDSFWYKETDDMSLLEVCDRTMRGEFVWPEKSLSYEETAEALYMSTNTVKYHVKNLLQKTGCHSRIQLVAEVVEKRLILPNY